MNTAQILSHVDHTLLTAAATWPQIETLCREAIQYHTASMTMPMWPALSTKNVLWAWRAP